MNTTSTTTAPTAPTTPATLHVGGLLYGTPCTCHGYYTPVATPGVCDA